MDRLYTLLEAIGYPHPLHPQFTHITIGIVFAAFLFGLLSLILGNDNLRRAGRYCAVTALVSALVTAFFGVADWRHFFAGGWLQPIRFKLVLAALLVLLLAVSLAAGRRSSSTSAGAFTLYVLSLFAVVGLGYFGSNLVYSGRAPPGGPRNLAGEHLFRGNCSGCHPYGGNIADPSSPLRGSPQLKDLASFLRWIRDPRLSSGAPGAMPAFPKVRLSDDQASRLYAYIRNVIEGVPWSAKGEGLAQPIKVRKDPGSVKKGAALFQSDCARCHAVDSTRTIVGPGLKGVLKRPRLPVSHRPATPANVFRQLRFPYKSMPSFRDKLSDDQVLDLIAFLATR